MVLELLASGVTSSLLLAAAAWLARTWIAQRLAADIRRETDERLAAFTSQIETQSHAIKEIRAVTTGSIARSHGAMLPRRITAVESLWSYSLRWQSVSAATLMAALVDEKWVSAHGKDPSTKKNFEATALGVDLMAFLREQNSAEHHRPFVSEEAWALFYVIHAFHSARLAKAIALTIPSLPHVDLWRSMDERALIERTSTPEILSAYDRNQFDGSSKFMNDSATKLLRALKDDLTGESETTEQAKRAAMLLQAAEPLARAAQSAQAQTDSK